MNIRLDPHPVVIADTDGHIVFWSEGAAAAFGYGLHEALGQSLDLIVPLEYREAHWRGFQRALACGEAAAEGQSTPFPVRSAQGEIVERQGRLTLIREPHGRVIGAAVVFGERTEVQT